MNVFDLVRILVRVCRSLLLLLLLLFLQIACVLAVSSGVCFGDVDVELYGLLREEAVPYFKERATKFLHDDYSCQIIKTDTARPAENFTGELYYFGQARTSLVKWRVGEAQSASATNEKYSFDVYRNSAARSFEISSLAGVGKLPRLSDLILPECHVGGIPGWIFFDIRYFRTRECKVNLDGTVTLNAECISDVDLEKESYGIFGGKCIRGVIVELVLKKDTSWRITESRVHGTSYRWQQDSERHELEVTYKMSGFPDRIVRYQVTAATVPRYDDVREQFYLSYYGLSESTAGYLMGSRRYILVFCALFFGAILFRLLAYVLKRRRERSSGAAS